MVPRFDSPQHLSGLQDGQLSDAESGAVGPVGAADFDRVLRHCPVKAPLRRNIRPTEVGASGLYPLSDLSTGVTGEIHYVDCGYNVVGW